VVAAAADHIEFTGVGFGWYQLERADRTAVTPTLPLTVGQPHPNPFHAASRIGFHLGETSPVTVDVFDVRGRRVRRLLEKSLAAGDHEVSWDGVAADGRRVAPGVYFMRLSAPGVSRTVKLVRMPGGGS